MARPYHHTAFGAKGPDVRHYADDDEGWNQVWFSDANVCMFVGDDSEPASVITAADALIAAITAIRNRAVAELPPATPSEAAGEAVEA